MNQQERAQSHYPDRQAGHQRDPGVGGHGADPGLPAIAPVGRRNPILQIEEIERSYAEHDQRMPVKPVLQATPP
jgi:hypothetical protein